MTSTLTVTIYATLTAIATGLGALPLLVAKHIPVRWLSLGNAFAGGLMLAASFNLIYEGRDYGAVQTLIGVVIGLVLITAAQKFLDKRNTPQVGDLAGADALAAILIVGVMTLHSFAEGIGIGVAFGGGDAFGRLIAFVMAVQNIPEGLAISLILVPKGVKVWKAGLWSIFSSLPQPLLAVPTFLFVLVFKPVLPFGLGLAAGAMIWMVIAEVLPEACENASPYNIGIVLTGGVVLMMALQFLGV
jgi:zinc transporter ZupT